MRRRKGVRIGDLRISTRGPGNIPGRVSRNDGVRERLPVPSGAQHRSGCDWYKLNNVHSFVSLPYGNFLDQPQRQVRLYPLHPSLWSFLSVTLLSGRLCILEGAWGWKNWGHPRPRQRTASSALLLSPARIETSIRNA